MSHIDDEVECQIRDLVPRHDQTTVNRIKRSWYKMDIHNTAETLCRLTLSTLPLLSSVTLRSEKFVQS